MCILMDFFSENRSMLTLLTGRKVLGIKGGASVGQIRNEAGQVGGDAHVVTVDYELHEIRKIQFPVE